ncbi:uncharacterized protein LOC100279009 [Zea mays]|uniref:Uncharacterized protein n=1 Tax=Zea mays TaxID=4577 RepID=B6UGF6_MAIZE|nr:uncharacterized protein LOC100279009 [Zea mays]ACG48439.1 hypothetical protein [Zea mays]
MEAPRRPCSSLVLLLRFLAILAAAAFFIVLAVHVEPVQGGRQPNPPPSPEAHPTPQSHCCNRR